MSLKNSFKYTLLLLAVNACFILTATAQNSDTLWFQRIDLSRFTQQWKMKPPTNLFKIAGQEFKNGLSSHTEGFLRFELNGNAQRFHALVGVDDSSKIGCKIVFSAKADGKEVFRSPVMTYGSKAVKVDLDLKGVKELSLIIEDDGTGLYNDRADYINAYILYKGAKPIASNYNYINKRNILTPPESPYPRINGAKVFGVRPGHP
ncbi:MAG: NPCBM/NEW2 domain-containing protein, partial [Ginsengibacter sp.]